MAHKIWRSEASQGLITKHTTIMRVRSAGIIPDIVEFDNDDGGDPEEITVERIKIDHDTWFSMGKPHTITVTVEPGDLLNVDGEF